MKITHIYIMRDVYEGYRKIGYSVNPDQRANQIGGMIVERSVAVGPRRHANAVEQLALCYARRLHDKVTFERRRLHSGATEMINGPLRSLWGCILAAISLYRRCGMPAVRKALAKARA